VLGHARYGLGMFGNADTEGLGDAVRGDVVVRRPDAAGCEHIVEFLPDLVHGVDDRLLDVGDDPALPELHAELVQLERQEVEVGVFGATAQDFVADDQQAGCDVLGRLGHLTVFLGFSAV